MRRALILLTAVIVAAALLAAGYVGGRPVRPAANPAAAPVSAAGTQRTVLYWYDPMAPQQHFDRPGVSPMGMQMVPRYADEGGTTPARVRVDPTTLQNLGVRTALVERRVLSERIEVPGTVTWDLRQAVIISARVDATVARLNVRAPYTSVAAGDPLADLLAPQWSSALAEYGALRHARSAEGKALLTAARERLQLLGLTDADLHAARDSARAAITLHAPRAGVVTTLDVREGQRVAAGQTLMTLTGLSSVWVEAALPQALSASVTTGTPVTVRVDALPGRRFQGKVETLLPDLDAATRTRKARIVVDNAEGALAPGMFATVTLHPVSGTPLPVVPDEALIDTGAQTRVIVAEGDGRFQPVAVRTGRAAGGYTAILEGLQGNERVVVSGQFLIDSEASLSGALERLGGSPPPPTRPTPTSRPTKRESTSPRPNTPRLDAAPSASAPAQHAHPATVHDTATPVDHAHKGAMP